MEPAHEDNELLAAADLVGHSLSRLLRLMNHVSQQRDTHFADRAAYLVLNLLSTEGPRRANALAEALHSDPSTISRQVAHLVEEGMVERVADPTDGRATLLAVTERGMSWMESVRLQRDRAIGKLLEDWEPEDRRVLGRLLARFVDSYDRHLQDVLAAASVKDAAAVPGPKGAS